MEVRGKTGDSAQTGRIETDIWFVLGRLNKCSGCHVWALHTAGVNNTVADGVSRWNWGGSDGSDVQLFVAASPGTIQVVVRLKDIIIYIGCTVFGLIFGESQHLRSTDSPLIISRRYSRLQRGVLVRTVTKPVLCR